ncbi:Flp family type IVb pilin [Bosea sp. 117]|uniref:Flp family type IVb pilin n=1 Tax=Bosea sp. 117 TaxID=1125973 RepID=UPI0009DE02F5|nr:Flp family type IVb pilin [Bosea sp. 117]
MTGYRRIRRHDAAAVLGGFWRDQGAATAIEYALVASSIGAAIAATVYTLGDEVLTTYYTRISEAVASASPN